MYYCVYLAFSKHQVLDEEQCQDPNIPKYPPEIARVKVYDNKYDQMECYANTMCPASMTFEADTKEEVDDKVDEFKRNFINPEWLKTNIDPYI